MVPLARIWEKSYPLLAAAVAGYFAWRAGLGFENTKITNQLSSTINVSAILMGFLGTAKAMLLSFNSRSYQAIRGNKHLWSMLLGYFSHAMLASLALCVYSLVLFSIDEGLYQHWTIFGAPVSRALLPIWVSLSVFAFLAFFRILRVIFALLKTS